MKDEQRVAGEVLLIDFSRMSCEAVAKMEWLDVEIERAKRSLSDKDSLQGRYELRRVLQMLLSARHHAELTALVLDNNSDVINERLAIGGGNLKAPRLPK